MKENARKALQPQGFSYTCATRYHITDRQDVYMHNILDCVNAFRPLLDTEYRLILGRKGIAVPMEITFDKKDCYHLMGLQYLTDRVELRRDRAVVFDGIEKGVIRPSQAEASCFYKDIADRVDSLPLLESLLDRNDTVFKYNRKRNVFSMIEADYLMKSTDEIGNIFVFLSRKTEDRYFCRSFFRQSGLDYTKNQALWTLLYKEKYKISEGKATVLYDRLKHPSAEGPLYFALKDAYTGKNES